MIDFSYLPTGVKIALGVVPFTLSMVGIGMGFYIAGSRHFNVLCRTFKNSNGLVDDLKYWSTISIRTRSMVVNRFTLAAVWPNLGIRQGWLNAEDFRNCPVYLKRRLQVSFWCSITGCTGIVAGGTLIELGRF
ncbi:MULTISPECIES: hypothetical protein [unclassified Pseudomonas]|jgi:hypothetical protein|uniref:hypothetical protein n=1 Tax=unclassified Pseudomonas TaxID=196821 RepID=UPI000A0C1B26|nr:MULTISPECIES: hypothetical protein [unclassified Pseudomonas]SMF31522.1 hypothetical protein SAMN02745962_03008 [Pseudomonas sp. LAIL14HWK12:I11]SMR78087.1 hypothetical protein SAMN05661028_03118 [Pseudomonas sp. LAIL14HWK12:I10]SOD04385.1 hypothetical protein SAMN05660296_02973 [Pseudomonas sp. LAIL14HWK12:I8]